LPLAVLRPASEDGLPSLLAADAASDTSLLTLVHLLPGRVTVCAPPGAVAYCCTLFVSEIVGPATIGCTDLGPRLGTHWRTLIGVLDIQ
jgi:hypothetical protein